MNDLATIKDKLKKDINKKYDWLEDHELERAFNYALSDYLLYKYPSENNRPSENELVINFIVENWVSQRMEDILSRAGGTNVTAYSENGMNWEYARSHIDDALVNKITPKAAVPL